MPPRQQEWTGSMMPRRSWPRARARRPSSAIMPTATCTTSRWSPWASPLPPASWWPSCRPGNECGAGGRRPESGDVGGQPRQPQPALDELKSSAQWLEHAALVGGDLVRLAGMELRLAAGDSGRMLLLALAMIPVAILAWTGLSVLLAWLVFIW